MTAPENTGNTENTGDAASKVTPSAVKTSAGSNTEKLEEGRRDSNAGKPEEGRGDGTEEIETSAGSYAEKAADAEDGRGACGRETASSTGRVDAPVCIQLKDVGFSYDGRIKVLDHLNITIHSGEIVTFTGRTGAGKSTIFKLLLGLYEPQSGEVTICGRSAASIKDSERRRIFGYVEQTYRRVPGTVRDQIALFDPAIDDRMIEKAIETAHLSGAIHALPDGLDTVCQDGIFSQGQWQLLSIARAIAAQPPILLLDEINANLDADTEKLVLSALRSASRGRTVLSISHRLYEDMGGRQIVIREKQDC